MEFIQQYQEMCVESLRLTGEVLAWLIPIWLVTSSIIFAACIFVGLLSAGVEKIKEWIEQRKE